jgi:hypothetical protein
VSFDAGVGSVVAPKLTNETTVTYAISQYPEFAFPAGFVKSAATIGR